MNTYLILLKELVIGLWQASDSELWYSCLLGTILQELILV